MAKKWYAVHTYSGYEKKVKANLEHRRESMGMEDVILDIRVPTMMEVEVKEDGRRKESEKKVFPGYVLVRMELNPNSEYVVRNTPGVTGFVGSGGKPSPISPREFQDIERRTEPDAPRRTSTDLQVGQVVKIVSGPLTDFEGPVSEVNIDAGKVRVMVTIFGRETPTELDFDQVRRI